MSFLKLSRSLSAFSVPPLIVQSLCNETHLFKQITPRGKRGARGVQWDAAADYRDGFERVFVASNATAVSAINAKLAAGLHVVLAPGVCRLR